VVAPKGAGPKSAATDSETRKNVGSGKSRSSKPQPSDPQAAPKSWRDVLPVHPAADLFPLMAPDELKALAEDIKKNDGLQVPIILFKEQKHFKPVLLDGRNRLAALELAGFTFQVESIGTDGDLQMRIMARSPREKGWFLPTHEVRGDYQDPYAFIISANIHRRHLTAEQKRELIAKLIKVTPEKSDRQIAETVKASPTTVGTVRAKMEATGDVSNLDTRTDSKGRQQPARKTSAASTTTATAASSSENVMLEAYTGEKVPYPLPKGKAVFNATNDQVSWAAWTWNPVTGCLHNCEYCYAREIANLRPTFPKKFEPLFHHERLDAPANTKVSKGTKDDPRLGRVFVVSMGDLYGKWVPEEWIERVHASCIANPQWEYLMLTKFPQRYVGLQLPPTAWLGTTVDDQYRVKIAEEAFRKIKNVRVKWLSLEPLLAPLEFTDLSMFDWIVIGAQSATEQPPPIGHVKEFAPPLRWVMRIIAQADEAGVPVYCKPNLLGIPNSQSPGMTLPQAAPRGIAPLAADEPDPFDIPPELQRTAPAKAAS
jgi:protein gp37